MSINIISQNEVDALLKGLAAGAIITEDSGDVLADVQPYDFIGHVSTTSNNMPGLELIHYNLSKLLSTSVFKLVMRHVDIHVRKIETMQYNDFIHTVSLPSSMSIFTMDPLAGYALLVLEAPVVFAIVEIFFGGSTIHHIKSEGKAFTLIEQEVISQMVDAILKDIESAWQPIFPVKTRQVNSELNPPFIAVAGQDQKIINIELQLAFDEFSGKISLCIPDVMLEPIREKLCSGMNSNAYASHMMWAHLLTETLIQTDLNISADLGWAVINFEDLLNLKEGSILHLGQSVSEELVIKIEGRPKFKGIPGISKGKMAVKLSGSIN